MTHVLALDLGTSSFRVGIADGRARFVRRSLGRSPVQPSQPEPRASELNAEALALNVETLMDSALEAGRGLALRAVGMSTFWHSLMGVDARGTPTTPLLLWSDLRATEDAARLRLDLSEHQLHARTGTAIHPTFWPAKLRWLARIHPRAFKATRSWLSLGDFLYRRWFGSARTSLSQASATGLLDQEHLAWDEALLQATGIDAGQLPPLREDPLLGAEMLPEYQHRWPGLATARWLPAIGDGACSNIGVGAVERDTWTITVGTSAAVRVVTRDPPGVLPWGLWRYRLDRDRSVIGGATNNAGNLFAWLQRTLRIPGGAALELALSGRSWGAHGLHVDPSLAGERSPDWPLNATGAIHGLTLQTSTIDIAQALLEASANRIGAIGALLEDAVGPPRRILATGGAIERSVAFQRMLQTSIPHPIAVSRVRESSLRGAAILATETVSDDS